MTRSRRKACLLILVTALCMHPGIAGAFRCKNKLVVEGMIADEVIAVCGEPNIRRDLGFVVRGYDYAYRGLGPAYPGSRGPGYRDLTMEVRVTEFVYNFGPRKLMQRLRFEGDVLVEIETAGYGYNEEAGDGR